MRNLDPAALSPEPDGATLVSRLARGRRLAAPVLVLVAHPDDETLGLGSSLARLERCVLVHVTPGAPRTDQDALRAGFANAERYAAARAGELDAALAALGAAPVRRQLGYTDQEVVQRLADLTAALEPPLAQAALVITHAYEGGHPDHDACAFAVQAACTRLRTRGQRAPARAEFAGYHLGPDGERVTGAFWPDPARPAQPVSLGGEALAAKCAALAAYRTQAEVVAWFDPAREALRLAPDYDFAAPPPPGRALYDQWGWTLTSQVWRRAAGEVMALWAKEAVG